MPADIGQIKNYLEPIFQPVIESGELTENIFNAALNLEIVKWIEGLEDRINNTNCLY